MIDKPAGMTSHDVVAAVRRRFRIKAVGHTGTLDPFATGLLVVMVGGATRLARFVEAERKTYLATARLGFATTTDDGTGERAGQEWSGEWPAPGAVEAVLDRFVGSIEQRPPAYSAKKVDGVRSYALARQGRAVDLKPATVTIDRVTVVEYAPPLVSWRAVVGPGTYLRALARDLGESLGTGGHLVELRRESVGPFHVHDAVPLASLTGAEPLIEPLALLGTMPRVTVSEEEAGWLRQGRRVGETTGGGSAALVLNGQLVAIGTATDGAWQPVLVMAA